MAQFTDLPAEIQRQLQDLYLQVLPWPAAERIWQRLTDAEQQQLGDDFQAAYAHAGGTAELWAELRGVDPPQAIVEVAHELGFLHEPRFQWFMREIGAEMQTPASVATPHWDHDRGELHFQGQIVRRVRGAVVAANLVAILDAFETEGWPTRIDDPLPGGRDSQRLREAVRTLNVGLTGIVFRSDGSGQGILWVIDGDVD